MSERSTPRPAARGTADPTPAEQLVRAVLEHRTVSLVYEGLRRIVEPHLIGIHEAGEPMVAAFQTGGFSHSGDLPGWRMFITTRSNRWTRGRKPSRRVRTASGWRRAW